jgi:hypothetical protein
MKTICLCAVTLGLFLANAAGQTKMMKFFQWLPLYRHEANERDQNVRVPVTRK